MALSQIAYRFREDDEDENDATWAAALNTDIFREQEVITRLRIATETDANDSINPTLWFSLNGGAWTKAKADGTTLVDLEASAFVTDGTATTQQITTGAFKAGQFDFTAFHGSVSMSAGDKTEAEYCFQILNSANDGDTIDFRAEDGNGDPAADYGTYTEVGRITVGAEPTGETDVYGSIIGEDTVVAPPVYMVAGEVLYTPQDFDVSSDGATLGATLPALTASFDAEVTVQATLGGSLPSLRTSFQVSVAAEQAEWASTLPSLTVEFDLDVKDATTLAASLPSLTAAFDLGVEVDGTFAATLPSLTASFSLLPPGRSLDQATIAELQAAESGPRVLVHIEFDSGSLRLWNGIGDLTALGETWTGAGRLGTIQPIKETQEVVASGVELSLLIIPTDEVPDAVDAVLNIALAEEYQGRPVTIYQAHVDLATGTLVSDPFIRFRGKLDTMEDAEEPGAAIIKLTAENRLIDLERPRRRTYTPEDQRASHPGDAFYDGVAALQKREIKL